MNMLALRLIVVVALCGAVSCRDLLVGAFNIQVYGVTKAKDSRVMDILVKIIRRYDLILIQEIRDASQTAIKQLLDDVNNGLAEPYSMLLSKPLGRSRSKEQYAYFYRPAAGLEVVKEYVYDDTPMHAGKTGDLFEREPYIVSFKSKNTDLGSFGLIGIHVDPDVAMEEINHLYNYVIDDAKVKLREPNLMILGDLNADCSYVTRTKWKKIPMKKDPEYNWLIGDEQDTTVKGSHCAYDRFIATGPGWSDGLVSGSYRVFRFDQDTTIGNMDRALAEDVSDHYPIEFLLAEKQNVIFGVTNRVYITLGGAYANRGSLPFNEFYKLRMDHYTGLLQAYDKDEQMVGWLNSYTQDEITLTEELIDIIKDTHNEVEMFIEPIKNRYSGKQKSELFIAVPAANKRRATLIWDILNFVCKKTYFKCTRS